jgi:membrane associated rhomboid family serine protease
MGGVGSSLENSDISMFGDARYFDPRAAAYFVKKEQLKAKVPPEQLVLDTYYSLPADDRLFEHFEWYQLFLSLFIHASILHLIGNMLFLYVFGGRVNALIGNVLFIPLYLFLGLAAGAANYFSGSHGPLVGTLGASGAIMGLAGVYFIFFPVQKIRIVAWVSLGPLWRTWGTFAIAGFWMLVLWVGFNDLLPTLLHRDDQIAHWEHLGGFVAGMVVALAMLFSRQINTRGADILSVMLGKYAWPLIGRPTQWRNDVPASILAEKITSLTYR